MNRKTIVVLLGHPDDDSLCAAIATAYCKGAEASGANVIPIRVAALSFDPIAHHYAKPTVLEPDLLRVQESIRKADHITLVYPIWWGGMPALLKGLIDRALTSGFGLRYLPNGRPQGLLKGKTMDILNTTDVPPIAQWLYLRGDALQMKNNVFGLCGIDIKRHLRFGAVHNSTPEKRARWLLQAESYGKTC